MNVSIVSVFKDLYIPFCNTSLVKRAQDRKIISLDIRSFFEFVEPKERIDAPTFGPGAGMLIKPMVVENAINTIEKAHGKAYKIFFSPQGKKLTQPFLHRLLADIKPYAHVLLLPARYEGMDARVEQVYADETVSVGDFVLMGGDLPAMMLLEGLLRLIPGVVGKEGSVQQDSFTGPFVDYPEYTEPVNWQGIEVPEIVRSGNHALIDQWREEQAIDKTVFKHFSWLRSYPLLEVKKQKCLSMIPAHYVVLMHDQVLVGSQAVEGNTSVMTIDIHDIARSCATYGIKNFFLVTSLEDQQAIVKHFLSFWQEGFGAVYNKQRHEVMEKVAVVSSLQKVVQIIAQKEGRNPLLLATSARQVKGVPVVTYDCQETVWSSKRPIILLFGTGKGISEDLISRCDYLLAPIEGFTQFNHLSVRSAAAIVLDRWLGLSPVCSNSGINR